MTTAGARPVDLPGRASACPFLGFESARRLCIDLIASEQERLLRERRISPRQRIEVVLAGCRPGEEDGIEISEESLGFDSLMLLDLVGVVSRYFCLGDSGAEDLLLVHRSLGDWARIVVAHFERVGIAARIGFETSGSTGKPKRIVHSADVLAEEVDEHLSHCVVPAPERVLSMVPPRHIYGFLWSVLLPQIARIPVLDLHRSTGEALFRVCRPGDLVIGTSFTWERAGKSGGRLPAGVCGITSGGPSTDETWKAAADLRLQRLMEIYGSTETGGIGWRDHREIPFRLFGRISGTQHELRRRRSGDALVVQDILTWTDDGTFRVGSRKDGMVQVAGTNVSLEAAAAVLRTIPGVADALLRLDGGRVMAVIVPCGAGANLDHLEDALRARARRELPAAARPDRYRFDEAIPRNVMGKPTRW